MSITHHQNPGGRWVSRLTRSLLAGGLLCLLVGCGGRTPAPLSVLLVTIDTLRADRLGCYGHAPPTSPVLDRLAAQGIRYTAAFTPVPLTLPSHATMFTGVEPAVHGIFNNGQGRLPRELPTLAEELSAQGYATAAFVSSAALAPGFGLERGFQLYRDFGLGAAGSLHAEQAAAVTVDAAFSWLDRIGDRRFFLWVHLFDPHIPYDPPPEYRARFLDPYDGEVAYTDAQVGRLLQRLDQGPLARRTAVCVLGDHGEGLGDHGEQTHGVFLYDTTVRIPLLVRVPGGPRGVVREELVSTQLLRPTVRRWAGLGEGEPDLLRPPEGGSVYLETRYPLISCGWSPLEGWRTAEWKYIRAPRPELYAVTTDPGEERNRWEGEPNRVRALADRLEEHRAGLAARAPAAAGEGQVMDPAMVRKLTSLGYVAGAATTIDERDWRRADPKDRIHLEPIYHLALEAWPQGKPDLALAHLESIFREDPTFRAGLITAAQIRLERGEPARAEAHLDALVADDPGRATASLTAGRVCREGGHPAGALRYLERAAAAFPDHPAVTYEWGRALLDAERAEEAIPPLTRAAALNPGLPAAPYLLARACAGAGRAEEALAALRRAVEAGWDRGDVLTTDPGFAMVRDHPEFQQILRMTSTATPPAP